MAADIIAIPDPAVCETALRHFDLYNAAWKTSMDFGVFMLACGIVGGFVIGYYAHTHRDKIIRLFKKE